MGVTFQVVGANVHKVASPEQTFTAAGTIGRVDDNTMVLPDPERFISSHHAAIEERPDGFYLVDTSINGTFVNGADQPIGHGNAHRLENGDRIRIGEFELVAAMSDALSQSSQWPQASQSSQWPPAGTSSNWPPPADPLAGSEQNGPPVTGDLLGNQTKDPLELFGGSQSDPFAAPSESRPAAPSPFTDQPAQGFGNFTPPKPTVDPFAAPPQDPFASPSAASQADPFGQPVGGGADPFASPTPTPGPIQSAQPAGGSVIPEDWDKTSMPGFSAPPPAQPSPPPQSLPLEPPPQVGSPPVAPPLEPRPQDGFYDTPPSSGAAPWGNPPNAEQPAAGVPQPGMRPAPPEQAPFGQQPPVAEGAAMASPAAAPRPGGSAGLTGLLEAAGLDPATARALDNQVTSQAIGYAMRLMVRELMEVLRARAEMKSTFRVPMTQIAATENNPLKFCVDEIDALNRLLTADQQGFLGLFDAVGEGFDDVKAHQMSMMAGMRAAFDHMLKRFDPVQLKHDFDQELRRSALFQPLNKTKYWDMLEELYGEIARDSDANFARLFGDEFARAYEAQMEQLSRHRNR